uniref:NADH dehydrogenase [ubiquinone] 1 beta subcomplex subunit 4 n=1 Tax=Anopheles christyi TaxID=43041 RepID=A0A182JXK3_9DIPT
FDSSSIEKNNKAVAVKFLPTVSISAQNSTALRNTMSQQEKAARRAALRNEYWRTMTNPHNHLRGESVGVFDTGLARFQAMRVNHYEHFKPTGRSFKIGLFTVVIPIIVYAKMMKNERDQREHQYRTGQVAYADRRFKFI